MFYSYFIVNDYISQPKKQQENISALNHKNTKCLPKNITT